MECVHLIQQYRLDRWNSQDPFVRALFDAGSRKLGHGGGFLKLSGDCMHQSHMGSSMHMRVCDVRTYSTTVHEDDVRLSEEGLQI